MSITVRERMRHKGLTAAVGLLVIAAGLAAPALAATRATSSFPLDPNLEPQEGPGFDRARGDPHPHPLAGRRPGHRPRNPAVSRCGR